MIDYGIEEAVVYPEGEKGEQSLTEAINDLFHSSIDETKSYDEVLSDTEDDWNPPERELNRSRPVPEGRHGELEEPDWDGWLAAMEQEGAEQTSSNDLGVYNSWYEKGKCEEWIKGAKEWCTYTDEPYQETEFEDFRLFLDVCRETGIEPLVVLMPLKGELFDETVYTADVRAQWYDRMKAICDEYGVEYVDFSPYEYDPYFLYDMAHFGWTGWVHVNRAIYEFYMGEGE